MLQIEQIVRRIFYVLLLALAPGFLFMVQVVIFLPPALIVARIESLLWAYFSAGTAVPTAAVGFLLGHFLLLACLYWLVAFALAKMVVFFRRPNTSNVVFGVTLVGIAGVSQLPIFGGGGHGPGTFGPLQLWFSEWAPASGNQLPAYLRSLGFFAMIALVWSLRTLRQRAS